MIKFWQKSIGSVTVAALILASANLLSRLLGVVRDAVFASRLGAGDVMDSYLAAFRLPDLLFNLLLMGALAAGLIPVFSHYYFNTNGQKKENENEAFMIIGGLLNYALVGWTALTVILFIFAPQVLKIFTPGFSPEKIQQSVGFTRIMLLSPLFLTASAIWGGVLQSLKKFVVFAFAPAFYNLGIIFGALYLVKFFGPMGLAWGVVLGAFLHMIIQLPSVLQAGWRPTISFKLHKGIKEIIFLTVPRAMSVGVSQINVFIMTLLASILASGSLSIFNFANNLQAVPVGLVGVSLATASFPSFSQAMANNNIAELGNILRRSVAKIMFLVLPASVLFFVIREPLVRLVFANNFFGVGKFNAEAIYWTVSTFQFFLFAIFAQSLIPLVGRAFFALKDTKTPFFVSLFSEAINFGLSFYFSRKMGVPGLALGFSIANIINVLLLWNFLMRKNVVLRGSIDWIQISKILVASAVAGFVSYYVISISSLNYIINLVLAGLAGASCYVLLGLAINIKEMKNMINWIKRHE
ncbi:MAG: murein biosynthesis integral membrane protein MurJ [Candidatus Portnoybacteria bacterium CG10_big_fil_rev_8_21_14_0_10_36_7]|uniref:Probable lipid II flippase MurJ n=1 Tax=Candidatus Portnoybacteria bacterium CG10_big_fil_rev_8_21_14_0_10_36_7 TaxID=1974812 RepID=A0A2M8KE35_9BACT|nr:MAG: murein biosynthesis integral membrane protein MurJ [Candidatus Portnoybacteria bacterium CG10_big_fil_rev_8_21_14_0_10_36_7]